MDLYATLGVVLCLRLYLVVRSCFDFGLLALAYGAIGRVLMLLLLSFPVLPLPPVMEHLRGGTATGPAARMAWPPPVAAERTALVVPTRTRTFGAVGRVPGASPSRIVPCRGVLSTFVLAPCPGDSDTSVSTALSLTLTRGRGRVRIGVKQQHQQQRT